MVRTHREALWEARKETVAFRADHRRLVDRERRLLSAHRQALERPRGHTTRPVEHRAVLEGARRLARENLGAHRRALAENVWLLKLVELYERVQLLRAERQRKKEAARPVAAAAVQT